MIRHAAILCALVASPVVADTSTLALPGTCRAYLTTQNDDCVVAHYVTCTGDPAGQQAIVRLFPDGGDDIMIVDGEYQWLTTVDLLSGTVSTLGPEVADPGTLSELIDDGVDSYDFTTTDSFGSVTRFVGRESLTGQTLTIDGVTLEEAQNEMRALDSEGNEIWRAVGTEYVSRDWRLFFSGPGMVTLPNESYPTSGTPVEFLFPEEPGFLSTLAVTGCPG
jgi:hypothetical protein